MSDNSTYNTDVTADPSKFVEGMNTAARSAVTASAQIDAHFKKLGETFNQVNGSLMKAVAVMAGGGALKTFIGDANNWNIVAGKMAKQMDISTERASVLQVALARLGIESDTYITAADKLSKQVTTNGRAFDVMGVKTRDAQGNYRNISEVMAEVNTKIGAITDSVARDEAGRQAYGKSWSEVRSILKVNADAMQQAEDRARQLGLIVGPEGVERTKQYKLQMNDLGLVGKSLEIQFGNALLPVFTKTGAWLSKEGPQAAQVFARILESVVFASQAVWMSLNDMGDGIGALMAQVTAVLNGNLDGARAIGRMRDEEVAKNTQKYEELKKAFMQPLPPITIADDGKPKKKRHGGYVFGDDDDDEGGGKAKPQKSKVPKFEADLEALKVSIAKKGEEENRYREMSKSEEAKYWSDILAKQKLSEADRALVAKKAAEAQLAVVKQTFEERVAVLQEEEAAYKNNTDKKLTLARQIQSMYQQGTKEYEAAAKRIAEINRQALEQEQQRQQILTQMKRDAALQSLALEEQASQQSLQLGTITQAQALQMQAQFEDRRFEIAHEALMDRLIDSLLDKDKNPTECARINAEIEQLEQQHQMKMGQIKGAVQANTLQPLQNVFAGSEQAISNSLSNIMQRTTSLRQGMQQAWTGITQSITGEIAKQLTAMAMAWVKQRAMAIAENMTNATKAGTGAAASQAAIPIVGPGLAAAAMAATFAAVTAMAGKVPSASQGFAIPKGVNPLTQLHEEEMVLPAKYADVIKSMADQGGSAAGGGLGNVHLNVSAIDARSFESFLVHRGGAEALVKALASVSRYGA